MASSTVDVTGQSPLSFTDANGTQRFVPLSALEFSGSKVQLKSAWASEFSGAEQTILLALASSKVSAGELTPPPVMPPVAAILFVAAVAGPEGNNITVSVTPDPGTALSAKVKLNAKRDRHLCRAHRRRRGHGCARCRQPRRRRAGAARGW